MPILAVISDAGLLILLVIVIILSVDALGSKKDKE